MQNKYHLFKSNEALCFVGVTRFVCVREYKKGLKYIMLIDFCYFSDASRNVIVSN